MATITLTPGQRQALDEVLRRTDDAWVLRRAQGLLWLARGEPAAAVARRLGVRRQVLYKWTARVAGCRPASLPAALVAAPRSGRPRSGHDVIDSLIADVIARDPRELSYHSTIWTAPLLAQHLAEAHAQPASVQSIRLALHRLGLRWKRPRHVLALRPATWRQAQGGSNTGSGGASGRWC